ncbi:MAG: Ppx/GppA phosphatase family protein [Eubacteriaceae bacterium]
MANTKIKIEKDKTTYGVIDIGTNSTRMLIFRMDKNKLIRVNKSVRYTRMGQQVNQTGELHLDAMKRNLEALEEYKNIGNDYEVNSFYVFGTSAMRDAKNSDEFVALVKEKLGFEIEIVTGEEEARFGFLGVSQCFDKEVLIFDIGGGSTELIYGIENKLEGMISLNIGCVRSTELHLYSDPPSYQEIERLSEDTYAELLRKTRDFIPNKPYTLIGIGGTATSLSTIKQGLKIYNSEKVHGSEVTRKELEKIIDALGRKKLKERQKIVGLEAKRADIILAGAIILLNILKITKEDRFKVCDYDNLEGAAYDRFVLNFLEKNK